MIGHVVGDLECGLGLARGATSQDHERPFCQPTTKTAIKIREAVEIPPPLRPTARRPRVLRHQVPDKLRLPRAKRCQSPTAAMIRLLRRVDSLLDGAASSAIQ